MTRPRPPLRMIQGGAGLGPSAMGPALELAGIGAGLTLTMALLGAMPGWLQRLGAFQGLFTLAFGFYALALWGLRRYARLPHVGLAVLAVALATRAALFPAAPSLSDDIYRYVWEGRVVASGGNPYRQSPLDPALAPLRDAVIYPRINHKELSTIYPPLAEAGFALVARVVPTVWGFKLWVVLHDLALVAVLAWWARRRGGSAAPALVYAWNPLVLIEYAGSGHHDPTGMLWLALALVLADSRPVASALALAAAALVKLAPLLALPFLLRRWPWRARWVALVTLAVGLGWFWLQTRGAAAGLNAFWGTWRNNELGFFYLDRLLGGFGPARVAALGLVAAALAYAWWRERAPAAAARLGLRGGTLVSPVVHPWYLGWVLMLEPLGPSPPWLLLSFTAILNYGVFATTALGRDFHPTLAWRWVEFGVPLLLALGLTLRARRAPAAPVD
ncbi:MAG: hypothetical protein A2V63_02130 [Candidatus Eisenbacteria bacterium RBG_19FT_COMBO_70_11]|nr:MAG: hypothetical protein A2V63_02130 [Candidatus Eisenbacteria bacterium RBG_19FT_COMBO_70_11]